jgi:hypothetical membrane protein
MSGRQVITTTVGGCLWILAGVQFAIAQVLAAEAWNPPYSWTNNYISDLGNTACGIFAVPHGSPAYVCSPLAPVMNASFVVSGVLVIAGALLLSGTWPRRRMISIALVLWVIAGLGKIGVGQVPENTNISLHLLAALNIPVESVAVLLTSLAIVRSDRQLGLLGIALAILGLVGTVLGTAGEIAGPALYLGLGVGGMERVAEYPATIWRLLAGIAAIWSVASVLRRTPPTTFQPVSPRPAA